MIDCQELLAHGSVSQVKKAVQKAIEDSGLKRTMAGPTSEIHPAIKTGNALALYETVRQYGR